MPDITAMQVIDTAVKIGLGALISGLATYWVTKLNHQRELNKQVIQRRQDLIEEVLKNVEDYWHKDVLLYADVCTLVSPDKSSSLNEVFLKNFQLAINEVTEATKSLSRAESLLLLLGEKEAADLINKIKYIGTNDETIAIKAMERKDALSTEEKKVMLSELKVTRKHLFEVRNKLYAKLSDAYKRINLQNS